MSNRGRRFPVEILTPDEVERLIGACRGNGPIAVRNRALIALLWRSGLRITEALSLRPGDVREGRINVRRAKNGRQRTALYDARAAGYLDAWVTVRTALGCNGWQALFCTIGKGRTRGVGQPLDSAYVRQLLPKLAARAGIEKRTHAHGLRHAHASELAAERLPLSAISAQLGHSSLATTDAYVAKLTANDLADQMAAIGRML